MSFIVEHAGSTVIRSTQLATYYKCKADYERMVRKQCPICNTEGRVEFNVHNRTLHMKCTGACVMAVQFEEVVPYGTQYRQHKTSYEMSSLHAAQNKLNALYKYSGKKLPVDDTAPHSYQHIRTTYEKAISTPDTKAEVAGLHELMKQPESCAWYETVVRLENKIYAKKFKDRRIGEREARYLEMTHYTL